MADGARPPAPRAILLDAGETLLHVDRFDLQAGVRTFLESSEIHGRPSDPDEVDAWLSDLESVQEATGLLGDVQFSLGEWLLSQLPMSAADAAVAELAIWIAGVVLRPIDGASQALEMAHERGIALGVISNNPFSGRTLEFELRRQGFGTPLEVVLSSADCGRPKPSAEPFRTALAKLGVAAEDTWYIGDSWGCDVLGAVGTGLEAVWLSRDEAPDDTTPHRRAASWKDVTALVESAVER